MVGIYDDLTCKQDKTVAKPRMEIDLRNFSESLKRDADSLNSRIPKIKTPGVAGEAIQMRDESRGAGSMLDRIKLQ